MATWNTDNPKTSNQILEDVADIEENLQELHDVIEQITNGTLGTTEPAAFVVAGDTIVEKTATSGVTVDGVLLKDSEVTTDVINEKTGAAGVTIDGLLIQDGGVYLNTVQLRLDADADTYIDSAVDNVMRFVAANAVQTNVDDGALYPETDNDVDLGKSAQEFKNLFIDGVGYIDAVQTDVIQEDSAGVGVTIDGLNLKDGKLNTANSVDSAHYTDGSIDPEHFAAGAVAVQIFSLQTVFAEADGSDEAEYTWQGTDPYVVCRTWYYHSGGQATCYIKARIFDSGNGVSSARVVFGGVTVNTSTVDNTTDDVDGSGDISGVAAGWAEVTVSGVKSASSADSTLYELGVTIA